MALQAVTPQWPGLRALPDRTGQRGQSAPALSGAQAGRTPGLRALIFTVLGFVLLAAAALATATGQDRIHQQLAASPGSKRSFWKLCPPGSHMAEASGECIRCTDGVDYTSHSNALSSCLLCRGCKPGEEEKSPCTATKDTECQCKPDTFRGRDSPEFCHKCSTRCPNGMVVATPCTPWSDLQCVDQESGTQASGEALVPGKPVTMSLGLPTTPSPSSGNSQLVPGIVTAFVLLGLVLVLMTAYRFRKFILQGCGVDPKCMEKETEDQEQANLTHVMVQSPGEAERLLEPAGAEESQIRMMLVPANDVDSIEGLRMFFDYFATVVPYDSWDALMRQMGLTQNEILMARGKAWAPRDALYEMLEAWLSSKGREASINTLLDALETLGARCAKETIQDHLVGSGKYVYKKGEAGSAVSSV
ncbi:tumor necrosis factor receptor superfamily member 10B isoform X4 [Camelus dromedarius]|uniref:tumor necrosis factor receptor superfamily member 10B isoform X4 n=1 Tax=Camelus dromedarius TaxID=9838 RepID=UPI0012632664|nr:tumor necrosis factor receptor superfamily member 10B-like isoform X4 [Camelus dromedarius]